MIVSTAGHVDHGKTALIKALTGVDTDTLMEEKRRRLTVNIGFAYLPVRGYARIGFIDVPGHERFIKNALCGLVATDFILLVIAADDGPMPQTREHLAIIDLLGIDRGLIAITKIDRVQPEGVAVVKDQVKALVKATTLEKVPIFCVATPDNIGIDGVRKHLINQASAQSDCQRDSLASAQNRHNFRLAVDRTFNVPGVGLIATGTVFSGEIGVNDKVIIAGAGRALRVRGMRVQNEDAAIGRRGQRCALNLSGPGLRNGSIGRGDWVTAEKVSSPVDRFDAQIRVLADCPNPLSHWTPVHIHLATSELTARIAVLEGKSIMPGSSALVQIVADRPVGAVFADRFIVRDQSARRTIGGGHVIDIAPPRRGRASPGRIAWLKAINQPDSVNALVRLLELCPNGINLNQFSENRNLTAYGESAIWNAVEMVTIGRNSHRVGLFAKTCQTQCDLILRHLESWHRNSPDLLGLPITQLAEESGLKIPMRVFSGLIDKLVGQSKIIKDATGIRLAVHQSAISADDELLWKAVNTLLLKSGMTPMSTGEIALETGVEIPRLDAFLARANRYGLIIRLSTRLITIPSAITDIFQLIKRLINQNRNQLLTVPAFREASGIGRNRIIEILEYFDSRRITIRSGSGRRMLPSADKALALLLEKRQ